MARKKFKKLIAGFLCTCMCVSMVPFTGFAQETTVDFTDEASRGGWEKTSGNGTISFTDGEGEDGYMTLVSDGNTIFADTDGEKRADGYVEMDITNVVNSRFAIIFRYNSPTDWEGIGVDSGNWTYFTGKPSYGNVTSTKKSFASNNETHRIRVEYRGNEVTVYEDGTQIISQQISAFGSATAGTVGMRVWGQGEGYTCTVNVDNVRTGDLDAEAKISPEKFQIAYDEAGTEDLTVTLGQEEPALTEIKAGDTVLAQGEDYTVEGTTVTIKKDYVASLKDASGATLTFVFADGQEKDCDIVIEKADEEVSYTRDFADGLEGFEMVSGSGSLSHDGGAAVMSGNGIFIDQDSEELKNQEVEFTFDPASNNCNYGVVLRYTSPSDYLYVGPASQSTQHYTFWGIYGPNGQIVNIQDSAFILSGRVEPYKVKVRLVDNLVTIFVDNEEIYNGVVDITTKAGKTGFRTTASSGMSVYGFTQTTCAAPAQVTDEIREATISSDAMTVTMDQDFPRVISYDLDGTTVMGQEIALHELEINNTLYKPTVTGSASADTMTYHVEVAEVDIAFDVVFTVEENVLTMKVVNVEEGDTPLYTLNFPGHSLVSMSSKDPDAELRVNNYKGQTETRLANASASAAYGETTLAVLSNDNAAAAVSGLSYKNRHEVAYQTFQAGDHTSTGLWLNEYTYRGLDGEVMIEEPWVKVSVTKDRNNDGQVDYQDGAIALRDDCKERKTGADLMTSSWNMIAMNASSEAQYPFLRILDNAKRIALATDNFSQNIIIKGYQSEGHDAAHPDFANYNKRAGGLEDFLTLLSDSANYNANIGVHINQTDVYPEAPQYSALRTSLGAWSWYDSSSQIIRENDVLGEFGQSEQGMYGRMKQFYDEDTQGMLATTYVDVFFGTRWPLYNLINNINGRDMALATEYVDEMVSFSTFSHHFDQAYSGFGSAGSLVRFVDHNQSDSFVNSNLFRGAGSHANSDIGIDGWQNATDYNSAIKAFYERILPNKFLAQYPVMQYNDANKAVLGENNEVVTQMVSGTNVITLNDKKVAEGTKIFIPWDLEDEDGNVEEEGKIYHWNTAGGSTTWELPDSWDNVTKAALYKLSETGKEFVDTYDVSSGSITINADAAQAYVLYKEELKKDEIETADTMEWSTGSPVKDMGFDSYNFDEWKPSSTTSEDTDHITIADNNLGNAHLYITGTDDGQVEQTLTGLKKGQTYSASVWCITANGRKATIEIENGDETVSNYMDRSNVIYGVRHSDKYNTYAQRMQVRFTAESDTAVIRLKAAEGANADSVVDFDDVRVVKVDADRNPNPDKYTYWEDFENVDQGFGVFVSTGANQTHLSQLNPVNPENTPDVINGEYSLKVRAGNYIRTIPATVRFDAEAEYTVGVKYKSPSANAFTFAVKSDKAAEAGDTKNAVIASAVSENTEGEITLTFTTGDYDDYYIDVTPNAANEYYIDDLYVEEAKPINETTLGELIEEAKSLEKADYESESYKALTDAIADAEAVLEAGGASKDELTEVYKALELAMDNLVRYATEEDKANLQSVIDEMKSLLTSDYKEDEQWLLFQNKISEAEELAGNDKATQPEVAQMIQELRDAKNALNPYVDRTALRGIIEKAEKVDTAAIVDGMDLQTFLSSITEAKNADVKPGVTEEEIAAATQTLTDAYHTIVLKDDAKNEKVAAALASADVDQNYFVESDWKQITEAVQALTAMQSQSGVKAADFYAALDKLETALANELSRPVIPSSAEIPSSGFTLWTNSAQPTKEIEYAFDKNPSTNWHTAWEGFDVSASNPAIVEINMGAVYNLNQFSYLQRQSGGDNGKIQTYNLYVKKAAEDEWTPVVTNGTFGNIADVQYVSFDAVEVQYVRLEVTQGMANYASAAEFALYQKTSDFSVLQSLMEQADKIDKDAYTAESYKAVTDAYAAAEELLKDSLTDQAVIDDAAAALEDAISALVELAGDSDIRMLENIIKDAGEIDLKDYKDTEAFEAALEEAQALLEKYADGEEVTKSEVSAAALALSQEMASLEPADPDPEEPADKSAAEKFYHECLAFYKEADHSAENWKAYQDALAALKAVLDDPDATQSEVDRALEGLVKITAEMNKELGDDPDTPDEPDTPDDPDTPDEPDTPKDPDTGNSGNDTSGSQNNNAVQTGDTSDAWMYIIFMAAAAGAVLTVYKKKHS